MANNFGIVQIGTQIGLEALLIKPKRQLGDLPIAQATIEEAHKDELEITDQPVETGSMISDHAFMRPQEVIIKVAYSNSPGDSTLIGSVVSAVTGTIGGIASLVTGNSISAVKSIYDRFQALQTSRIPFTIYTGKRVYYDMLIKELSTTTTFQTENAMMLTVHCRQIIMVPTASSLAVAAPAVDQSVPQDTNPTADQGVVQLDPAPQFNNTQATSDGVDITV